MVHGCLQQVGGLCTDLTEQTKQHISIQGAFMSLVHNNSTVVVQVRLPQRLPEQDTICHVLYQGFLRCAVLKTNCIAHLQDTLSVSEQIKTYQL